MNITKTRYKHIHFDDFGSEHACMTNRNNDYLGGVSKGAWNRMTFKPVADTEFSEDCLLDIAHFILQLESK